jgi:predicted lysophospholipase L1 biosynthesis ABC-type transport system permease subunit
MPPVDADVDGQRVPLEAVGTGHGPTEAIVEGRAPARAGEVALGEESLHAVGARIGDRVHVRVDTASEDGTPQHGAGDLRVVGTALFNDRDEQQTEFGRGALVTLGGARAMGIEPFVNMFLVDYARGADEEKAYRSLQRDFGRTVLRRLNALDVENLRRVSGMPVALAALVGGLALAVLAHALVTTLQRRRRDLAVLRTVGFLRRQLGVSMVAFAGTTVVLGVLVGAPLGVAAGRVAWRLVADSLGTPAPAVLPVPVLILVAPLTLLVALVVAAAPARSAAATEPALVLRSE